MGFRTRVECRNLIKHLYNTSVSSVSNFFLGVRLRYNSFSGEGWKQPNIFNEEQIDQNALTVSDLVAIFYPVYGNACVQETVSLSLLVSGSGLWLAISCHDWKNESNFCCCCCCCFLIQEAQQYEFCEGYWCHYASYNSTPVTELDMAT